jgi:hypothetical protein
MRLVQRLLLVSAVAAMMTAASSLQAAVAAGPICCHDESDCFVGGRFCCEANPGEEICDSKAVGFCQSTCAGGGQR